VKTIRLGQHDWSKVICGSNPFNARSHFSAARDTEYRNRFSPAETERVLLRAQEAGVNAYETSASDLAWTTVTNVRQRSGRTLHFIGSTRIDETSDIRSHQQKLAFLIDKQAELCVIHAQIVDHRRSGDDIPGLERMLDAVHSASLLAGISTHDIATVELCERKRYAIDAYLFPLNLTGFVYPGFKGSDTPQERAKLVRGLDKTFILMKTLGAGRIPPDEGLAFAVESSKPTDLISLGVASIEELDESLAIAEKLLEGT
jgi:hypothetical protein